MSALAERLRPSTSVKDWLPKGQTIPTPYIRPADWLTLPAVNVGDQKFVGLHAVYNHDSNFVAVNCAAAYTVDWGDGTAAENIATGVSAYHNYVYSALGAGTLSSRGYRQAIVTITPQSGQNLTTVNLYIKHNQSGLVSGYVSGWLDIRMAGSLITTLTISVINPATVTHRMLEQFEFVGTNGIVSFSGIFGGCSSLRAIIAFYTAVGTNFTNMFNACASLQILPLINTAAGTNFTGMFTNCSALTSVPLLNTTVGTNFTSMFSGCYSLTTIPLLNTAVGTTFSSMFSNCYALTSIPILNTVAGTNFTSMFDTCYSLTTIPLINTAAGITFNSMFANCYALTSIPLINTATGTSFTSMFTSCISLQTIPLLNTAAGIIFSSMFNNCTSLQTIPLLNTVSGTTFTTMFQSCKTLTSIPALNIALGTSFSQILFQCVSLKSAPFVGATRAIDYSSCSLGPAALDAIYTALATFTNLLSERAASVEVGGLGDGSDWNTVLVNCATAVAGGISADGTQSLRLTSTASGAASAAITSRLAVSGSTQYTFLASSRGVTTGRAWTVAIAWYDAGGALISTDTSGSLTASITVFGQNAVTATSPSNAATASVIVSFTATAGAQQAYFDQMGLFPGTVSVWTPGRATITVTSNWGTTSDTPSIATAKGWTVVGS